MLSITQLTREIRNRLEGTFDDIWVEGEVSNYRPHASGHHYFTLKDAKAQLSCVMFRGQARSLPAPLKDGLQVQARGEISVYEARGQYQLIARWIQPKGFGELQARFEALKRQLDSEGLFDPGRKQSLPAFPRTVALITSPTGAAIRDMLNILRRRAPWLQILVWPVRVQGTGAAGEIASALEQVGRHSGEGQISPIDTVIVGRGGGSIEDLWSFNEEIVARAIHACPLPVISAVGHEVDFTIADFVADLRAPTPSAAAELVAPDGAELRRQLETTHERMSRELERALSRWQTQLTYQHRSLSLHEPSRVVEDHLQDCDNLRDSLEIAAREGLSDRADRNDQLLRLLETLSPHSRLQDQFTRLKERESRLERPLSDRLRGLATQLAHSRQMLELLNPESAFRRGFSFTTDTSGAAVTHLKQVDPGMKVRTRIADGEFDSIVE